MNEFLSSLDMLSSLQSNKLEDVGILVFLLVLLTSAVSSYAASLLYLTFYGGNSTGSQVHRAFPLLGISITAIFISIQFSLPLSLGLLGALSIVRFRTPIKEPEEIGFIMLVVALALSCAIFNFKFVLLLLVLSLLILIFLMKVGYPVKAAAKDALVIITLPKRPENLSVNDVTAFIANATTSSKLESMTEEVAGPVLITYRVGGTSSLDIDALTKFIKELDEDAVAELYLS
jgi:hypothetical protein